MTSNVEYLLCVYILFRKFRNKQTIQGYNTFLKDKYIILKRSDDDRIAG